MNKHKSRWLAGLVLVVIVVFVAGLGSRLSLVAPVETTFSVRPGRTSTGNTFGCQRCSDETTKPSDTRGAHICLGVCAVGDRIRDWNMQIAA